MTVHFLTVSYAEAWSKIFLDDCLINFDWSTTTGSSFLVYLTSIGATVRRYILLIYSDLSREDTWMEAAHTWVFVVKF